MQKAAACGADALILDLEDSVAPSRKAIARKMVASFLANAPRGEQAPKLIVRVNALDTWLTEDDLTAVVAGAPDAILLPKASSGRRHFRILASALPWRRPRPDCRTAAFASTR